MGDRPCPPRLERDVLGVGSLVAEESALGRAPMADHEWQLLLLIVKGQTSKLDQDRLRSVARHIKERIQWLDVHMTRYCELTCPSCEDPCCDGLEVFYNITDLLALLALGPEIPPGQTREKGSEPCRYLSRTGCLLPRIRRPYVCVWFLCEAQLDLLQGELPRFQRRFVRVLEELRILRLGLETLYQQHTAERANDTIPFPSGDFKDPLSL